MPSARPRISAATSSSSASRPASRSARGSKRGSRRASPRASRTARAVDSRAPTSSAASASWTAAAPRAIASPCWAAESRLRISSASPGRSRAAAISAASCSSRSTRRASSRGSIASSASAARLARHRSTTSAIAARPSPLPPNASSRSRCQRSSSSRCWSCWPWISTSGPTSSASREAVVARSSSRAVERPPVVTSRTAISGSGSRSNRASTRADSAPWRMSPESALAPRTRPSASITRLFPAPVSPVMTLRPGPSGKRRRSMRARSLTVISSSRPAFTTAGAPPCGAAGPRTAGRPRVRSGGSAVRRR